MREVEPTSVTARRAMRQGSVACCLLAAIADLALAAIAFSRSAQPYATTALVVGVAALAAVFGYATGKGRVAVVGALGASWAAFVLLVPFFGAGFLYLPGALLQTLAWQLAADSRKPIRPRAVSHP